MKTGGRTSVVLTALAVLVAPPAATSASTAGPASATKLQVFRLTVTFTQKRPWTHYFQQVSQSPPTCTRTTKGNGLDDVTMRATAFFNYRPATKSSTGIAVEGTHKRVGVSTLSVAGECAPTYVFPSTWRIISEVGGTTTAAEPTSGCKRSPGRPSYATVAVVGKSLRLHWTDASLPEFENCPYFDGANEASKGNELPGASYIDVTAPISLKALANAAIKRIAASGTAKRSATETCANLQQRCPSGVTYNATGSVEAKAQILLVRR